MRYGEVTQRALWVHGRDEQIKNCVLGIAGESGEIADHFKKLLYHPDGYMNGPTLRDLRLELGDLLFYLSCLNHLVFGDSLLNVAKDNIRKLTERWPERYKHVNVDELEL
jgi:NTP pyrophosphatase (non-canonical NTP hydrolase)